MNIIKFANFCKTSARSVTEALPAPDFPVPEAARNTNTEFLIRLALDAENKLRTDDAGARYPFNGEDIRIIKDSCEIMSGLCQEPGRSLAAKDQLTLRLTLESVRRISAHYTEEAEAINREERGDHLGLEEVRAAFKHACYTRDYETLVALYPSHNCIPGLKTAAPRAEDIRHDMPYLPSIRHTKDKAAALKHLFHDFPVILPGDVVEKLGRRPDRIEHHYKTVAPLMAKSGRRARQIRNHLDDFVTVFQGTLWEVPGLRILSTPHAARG